MSASFPFLNPDLDKFMAYKESAKPEDHETLTYMDKNELTLKKSFLTESLVLGEIKKIALNRYPSASYAELRGMIAASCGLGSENVILGNGSDELIQLLLIACKDPGRHNNILNIFPSFTMYSHMAQVLGYVEYSHSTQRNGFQIKIRTLIDEVRRFKSPILFIANPNNPTGQVIDLNEIETLVKSLPDTMVVIDEAYFDYAGFSAASLVKDHKNLVVLRTLSKIGLAAIRLGYALANEELVSELNKVRSPYNINQLSEMMALVYFKTASFQKIISTEVNKVISEREKLEREFEKYQPLKVYPSKANFLWLQIHNSINFLDYKLVVKNFASIGLSDYYRITVGDQKENQLLKDAMYQHIRSS